MTGNDKAVAGHPLWRIMAAAYGGMRNWFIGLGLGQDGPAGMMIEDIRAR